MKCPYRDFQECIIERCPACNYEEVERTVIAGRSHAWLSTKEAIKRGNLWKERVMTYKFVSCKLVDNSVQPVPVTKQTINNTTQTNVVVRNSVF